MTLTEIEQYVFGGNRAHFVTAFEFDGEYITITLTPGENAGNLPEIMVRFRSARMLNDWTDANEEMQWPLDIIGFECHPQSERWKFVLNCGTKEWIWESNWPTIEKLPG